MDYAFNYVKSKGITTDANYPYKAVVGTCLNPTKVASITGFVKVTASEAALQTAVATIGPVSVRIDASQPSFFKYNSTIGVYNEPKCTTSNLNRAGEFSIIILPFFLKTPNKFFFCYVKTDQPSDVLHIL